jgi:phenylalanyl-tRNA synthetase beta chain
MPARDPVRVRTARVARLLGVGLSADAIAAIFSRLGLAFSRQGEDFLVTPPSYRFDLAIEEDYVEEIARLHGYDAIPAAPAAHVQRMLAEPEQAHSSDTLKLRLVERDWQEVITFSYVNSAWEKALFPDRGAADAPIAVLNPIASHLDVMRTTLLGGLIEVLTTNLARKQERLRVFEAGRCFVRAGQACEQPLRIGGLAYGDALPEQWGAAKRAVDFFDVKGDLAALAAPRRVTTERASHPALHPGRAATVRIDGASVGWLGELHPRLARHFELPRAPIVFELALAPLLQAVMPAAGAVSKLPVVRRDLAVVIDDGVPAEDVVAALEAARLPRIEALRLFDVYRGPGVAVGKKSLAILVLMRDTQRTLTDPEIDAAMAQLLRILADRFAATLRQ